MTHVNIILKKYEDLDAVTNKQALKDFLTKDNIHLTLFMGMDFANNNMCVEELESTYFHQLASSGRSDLRTYWCWITECYVLEMTKRVLQ